MARRKTIIKSEDSPALDAMKRTYNKATLNGGVTQDFSANVENIREISRKLGTNILPTITTRNLLKYSEEFDNAVWDSDPPIVTRIVNNTLSPDGTLTADKITENTSLTFNNLYQQGITAIAGKIYTFSVYVKAVERNFVMVGNGQGANTSLYIVDLTTGIIVSSSLTGTGTSSNALVTNAGNGWWRCSVSMTFPSAVGQIPGVWIRKDNTFTTYAGVSGSGIYLWGAQLEQNTGATTYQPTKEVQTNLELTNANFLYVPSSYGESKNFVQNPSLRNLDKFSEEFNNSVWTKSEASITADITIAPNGLNTADKVVENTANNEHFVRQDSTGKGGSYTFSIYAKASERSFIRFWEDVNTGKQCYFNLTNGTVTNSTMDSVSILNVGNGWYRCSATINSIIGNFGFAIKMSLNGISTFYTGDGVSGLYLWGSQLEQSPIPTPYQRTTDAISDFTFTRATSATVTNKLGVIEDSAYNLIQRSEEFDNAYWNKTNVTITANTIIAPNGALTADKLVETVASGFHALTTSNSIVGQVYNFSVYAKVGERSYMQLQLGSSGVLFNLTSGTIQSTVGPVTGTISNLSNGWYLCSMSGNTVTNGSNNILLFDNTLSPTYPGDGVSGVYIWGAQLTQGPTLRPYLKTTNRLNVPRLDYSRSLLEPSLLIEPQRTNLVLQSESPDTSPWIGVGVGAGDIVLTSNLNPFGVNRSYTIKDGVSTNTHTIVQTINVISGTTYTCSFYVKKASTDWCQFGFGANGFNNTWMNFNFTTGLFGNIGVGGTYTKKQLPNGWWLLTITSTAIATLSPGFDILGTNNTDSTTFALSYIGTNQVFCDFAAMQLEVGSNATSYIPTTTATVTRNAETSYVDLWNNNMLNKDNFTLFVEGYLYNTAAGSWLFHLGSNPGSSGNDAIGFYNDCRGLYYISSAPTIVGTGLANNSAYRTVIQVNETTVKFFRNGVQIGTTQTVRVFDYRYLNLVSDSAGGTFTVDKIALFNRTLSDLECASLTNPTSYTFEEMATNNLYTIIT